MPATPYLVPSAMGILLVMAFPAISTGSFSLMSPVGHITLTRSVRKVLATRRLSSSRRSTVQPPRTLLQTSSSTTTPGTTAPGRMPPRTRVATRETSLASVASSFYTAVEHQQRHQIANNEKKDTRVLAWVFLSATRLSDGSIFYIERTFLHTRALGSLRLALHRL